jgi:hypothetical protein
MVDVYHKQCRVVERYRKALEGIRDLGNEKGVYTSTPILFIQAMKIAKKAVEEE